VANKFHGGEGDVWGWLLPGITRTVNQLTKVGKMQSAGCQLCRKAREAWGESTGNLAVETYRHINRVGCKEMATTVATAHHSWWSHQYASMHAV